MGPKRPAPSRGFARLLFCSLFLGVLNHPLAQADEWVFVSARHGVGQLAQFDGESIQFPAQGRIIHETTSRVCGGVYLQMSPRGPLREPPISARGFFPADLPPVCATRANTPTRRDAKLKSRVAAFECGMVADDRANAPSAFDRHAAELDEREKALAYREADLAKREWLAEERDRIAGEGDLIAGERDRIANEREQVADERERRADEREGTSAEGEPERLQRMDQRAARLEAAALREQADILREMAEAEPTTSRRRLIPDRRRLRDI